MVVLAILLACSSPAPSDEAPAHEHPEDHPAETPAGHDHEAETPAEQHSDLVLTLDGTKKWAMDDHTREVMAETRATLKGASPASVDEVHALAGTLRDQLDRLIDGCTMDGAAHDELHVFLMAWIPKVDALAKADDLAAGKALVGELRGMRKVYDDTFE